MLSAVAGQAGPWQRGPKNLQKTIEANLRFGQTAFPAFPPGPEPTSSTKCATAAESAGATKERRDKDVPVQGLHLDACGGW